MYLLYNNDLLQEGEFRIPVTDRSFQYNDGFFETIMIVDGKIRFWQDHQDRMKAAADVLKLDLPESLFHATTEEKLLKLAESNSALSYGRLKLKIWRQGAGLYTPERNTANWLTTVQPAATPATYLEKVGICASVRTYYSPFSGFKGAASMQYVMAGLEKKERGFDDLIILDRQNLVSEFTAANICWCQNNVVFTPSLETGCINGIMRRNILKWCKAAGIRTREAFFEADSLLQADAVFSANVTGIKVVKNLLGFDMKLENDVVLLLQQKLLEV